MQNVLYYVYIGIAQFGTVYVSTVGFIYVGERITLKIREQYLKAMLRQNMAYFDEMGAGEVTTRITADTNLIQDGISEKVGMTLSAVSMFISGVIIAYIKSWKLALICTPTVLCLAIAMVIGYHFTVKFTSKSLERYGVGGSVAGDAISSIRTATAFGSHERLAQQYDNHLNVAAKYGIRMRTIQAVLYAALGAIMFSTQGLGFWRGSRFLVEGEVSVGQVLTVMMALINGSHSLGSVAPHAQAFTSAVAAATKIYSAIERQSPLDPSSDEGKTLDTVKGHIELRDVKHVYPSRPDVTVLKSVSLTIPAGRTTAFVGPSGSGKSTIIGLIERFYSPVQGEIFLDGQDTSLLNLRWLRQQISLVSQEPVLFSATIFDNIKYGLNGTHFTQESESRLRERIVEAAKMANAHQFIMSLPDGYETHVGQQGFLLSGGQKQRIAIARAVVSDPKILLLDEATSALDTKSEGVVQEALDKASEGRTTIVIAHRLSTIKSADNIIVLVDGRILEQGTHDELLEARGEYFKLVEAQQLQQKDTPTVEDEDSATDHDSSEELLLSEKPHKADLEVVEKGEMMNEDVAAETAANEKAKISEEWSAWTLIRFTASLNRPELKLMMIGFGFVFLSGAVQPVQAVIYSKAITTLSLPLTMSAKIIHDADFWSIMLLVIGISSFFTSSINSISFGIGAERLICRARSKAFRTILRQDVAFFDQDENTTGALVSFLSTETHHLTGVSGLTLGTITSITISLTAAFTVALAVGWKMALVCMSVVPVVLLCGFFRVSMLAKLHAHSRIAYKTSASYASEAISSVRTVASLSREDKVLENYHDQLISQVRAGAIPSLKSSLFYALSQGIYCFCTALGFWYGGTLLGRHEYTIFQFFLCFAQVIYGANSAGSIFSRAPDMAKAKSAAAEFKTLFDRKPAIDVWSEEGEAVDSVEGNIEFRDVHFRYPTRPAQPVLCGLNLTVKAGQFAALVGASGCGKSTTISLLERFYDVSSGGVYVDGRNISQLNVNSYRSQLALVSQEPMLYQGSIRDNILMGSNDPSVTDEVIIKACKDANIYDMVMSLPYVFSFLSFAVTMLMMLT